MLRTATLLLLTSIAASPVSTALAQSEPIRPAATSDVGPWESVIWTRGKTVVRCTLSRAKPSPDGFTYGFLADRQGVLLGVAHASWKFKSEAPVPASLKPSSGAERKIAASPASPTRANFELPAAMLGDLQKSEHLDLQIEANRAHLAFDDFNAARVVLESCLQQLGKDYEAGR